MRWDPVTNYTGRTCIQFWMRDVGGGRWRAIKPVFEVGNPDPIRWDTINGPLLARIADLDPRPDLCR